MLISETRVRVRYGETDRMGYSHHANYLLYFEEGRTEMLREQGLTYKQMEDSGFLMPVRDVTIEYLVPALYDDELVIRTIVKEVPSVRMKFYYEAYNQDQVLLAKGTTVLVFVDASTRRPTRPPAFFMDRFLPLMEDAKK